jgi:hypothetical protein
MRLAGAVPGARELGQRPSAGICSSITLGDGHGVIWATPTNAVILGEPATTRCRRSDVVHGEAGADTVRGGAGDDTMDGGPATTR